ncbi:MAG TPA: thioredoxin domain-containing protein [Candidatus Desulfaltia sp.]|nr:thioredoxin domain-containing protein [Candidatus Desulfaltia sp.]
MRGKATNRLGGEKSPYLRRHADNPVAWYPWGDEAFREAEKQDRPVFLSIGYSTCHWCHVMEKESFADEEVARLMNETFISIKVDREERPDVDAHYMAVCQLLTGSGGWPLTVIMTPDKKPFFAGTYFPKDSRFGLIGFPDLIRRIAEAWKNRRAELLNSAGRILTALGEDSSTPGSEKIQPSILDLVFSQLTGQFDDEYGGFGQAPKFPTPHHLTFLLRYARRKKDKKALAMVEKTLQAMRLGGIFDQLGLGFHRYSTDRRWLLPHFEKMLYDQALLAMAYTEAYQFTGKNEYRRTVEEIMTYVLRDLRSPEGAFSTAEDADSEGEEGKYYIWELAEIEAVLSRSQADLARHIYNLRPEGNYAEPGGGTSGKNILYLGRPPARFAADLKISEDNLRKELSQIRKALYNRREQRPRPLKDTKVLADWNGLMIAALAKAARALGRTDYAEAARAAAVYIRDTMTVQGKLHHRSAEGEVAVPAFLDDHAFLIWGLLELYEATFDKGFLSWAVELSEDAIRGFWDEREGGFFFTSAELHKDLPARRKELYDGALPSGNSVMFSNLVRLGRLLGRLDLEEKAQRTVEAFSGKISQHPAAYTQFLCGLDFAFGPAREVVVAGRRDAPDTGAMFDVLGKRFIPEAVVLFRPVGESHPEIVNLAPYTEPMVMLEGRATTYICSNYSCDRPTTEPEELRTLLDR